MFKYVSYTKVKTDDTVLEFRGGDELVKVNHFDVDAVSIEATLEADIDALVAQQTAEIKCVVITQAEFKTLVHNSSQLKRIREVVKSEIAKAYDVSDEIAIGKKAVDDVKRVAYESHVVTCLNIGYKLKLGIGYAV